MKLLNISYNKLQSISALEKCEKLTRLELQGNKIVDTKSFPDTLDKLMVLYLQEFDMSGQNVICSMPAYEERVYKAFPKLKSLDGNRKAVPMNYNMRDAVPEEESVNFSYNAKEEEWFQPEEMEEIHPDTHIFEDGTVLKREEMQFKGMLNDMKALLDKKTNILTY